jgi:hypothetical protein
MAIKITRIVVGVAKIQKLREPSLVGGLKVRI